MLLVWITAIVALALVFIVYAGYIVKPKEDDELGSPDEDLLLNEALPPSVAPSASVTDSEKQEAESEDEIMVGGEAEEEEGYPRHEIPIAINLEIPTFEDKTEETRENLKTITDALPRLPRQEMKLLPMFAQPGIGAKEIATVIQRDQTTAAKLLRWVNSSFYGLEKKIDSLHRAVTLLGVDTVRSAVLQEVFDTQLVPRAVDGLRPQTIWQHASAVGIIAKHLARSVRGVEPDVAATAGLLHDIGLLLLLVLERKTLQEALLLAKQQDKALIVLEDECIGFSHQAMSECFLLSWSLPEVIAKAAGKHHSPMKEPFDAVAGVLWLADYLASRLDFPCPADQVLVAEEEDLNVLLGRLGLKPPLDRHVTDGMLKEVLANTRFWAADQAMSQSESLLIT